MSQVKITAFEVVDYGLEFFHDFSGIDAAGYEHVAVGTSDDFNDALDDAIDAICYKFDMTPKAIMLLEKESKIVNRAYFLEPDEFYFVGIRYNVREEL